MSDIQFKICIFGDCGVGKTSLTQRFVSGRFTDNNKKTIGTDFSTKILEIDGKKVTIQISDFAGDEQFRSLLPLYVKGSSGAIFMYDITNFASIENINNWLNCLTSEADILYKIPALIVGGKGDLHENRAVKIEKGKELALSKGFKGFYGCSSKTGTKVEEIFLTLSKFMLKNAKETPILVK